MKNNNWVLWSKYGELDFLLEIDRQSRDIAGGSHGSAREDNPLLYSGSEVIENESIE